MKKQYKYMKKQYKYIINIHINIQINTFINVLVYNIYVNKKSK